MCENIHKLQKFFFLRHLNAKTGAEPTPGSAPKLFSMLFPAFHPITPVGKSRKCNACDRYKTIGNHSCSFLIHVQSSLCPAQTILSCIRNDCVFCRPCGCVPARCGLRPDASFYPDQANLLTPGSQIKQLRPAVKAGASALSAALSSWKRFLRHASTGRFHVRQPVPAPPPDGLPAYCPPPGRMSCQTAASAIPLTAERTAQTPVPARRAEASAAQPPDTGGGTDGLCGSCLPCTDLYFVYFSVS